ncbi:MAG: hypothetical protein KF764_29285 [Labilithrix sp.]|nr:hypothetical protein [Labilithrix sp.]MBX3223406.1 hypothetical protein [Labilithrix sp.]
MQPRTHTDRCDGSRLVYCDGQERDLDCKALGFAGCKTTETGATCG